MMIFPAIDLRGGHCVRLYKGDFSKEEIFSDHPGEMAKKWEGMGAKYLHVVDLDGARGGQSENLPAIREILSSVQIPIELGGGIRTMEQIESILALGVRRVILGSAAVESPKLGREAVEKYGERIVVGIDARDGVVAVKGWEESGGVDGVVAMSAAVIPAIRDKFTLILFAFCPFNLLKGVVVSLLTMLLYKRISPLLHLGDDRKKERHKQEGI